MKNSIKIQIVNNKIFNNYGIGLVFLKWYFKTMILIFRVFLTI